MSYNLNKINKNTKLLESILVCKADDTNLLKSWYEIILLGYQIIPFK